MSCLVGVGLSSGPADTGKSCLKSALLMEAEFVKNAEIGVTRPVVFPCANADDTVSIHNANMANPERRRFMGICLVAEIAMNVSREWSGICRRIGLVPARGDRQTRCGRGTVHSRGRN